MWTPNPKKPNFPLTFTAHTTNSSRFITRVLQHGVEVVSPENVSLPSPVIDTKEDKEDVNGLVAGGALSNDKTFVSSTRVKKKRPEEDSFENRFKLRNGREVS